VRNTGRSPEWFVFMRIVCVLAVACLIALAGCTASGPFEALSWGQDTPPPPPKAAAMVSSPASATSDVTGSIPSGKPLSQTETARGVTGDALSLGQQDYRERNYHAAERHFRRATEKAPQDGQAWLGLAASYDRLKRYPDADRAYARAVAILGPKADVINTIGYSYLLRGDLSHARAKFEEAQLKDPDNPTVANNLALVDEAERRQKETN
jgi:Tfp pilus assembly protein PilF